MRFVLDLGHLLHGFLLHDLRLVLNLINLRGFLRLDHGLLTLRLRFFLNDLKRNGKIKI